MIDVNGADVCTEAFGDPDDPPLLLIMGMGASMIWWEDEFCEMVAAGRRFVIRYDHRDTGRSIAYEPGHPEYATEDLVGDAAGVLDAYRIPTAHVAGASMGGALAQLLALGFPDRVASLVLISTTSVGPPRRELPPMSEEYARFLTAWGVDWSDRQAVIDHLVAHWRVLAGTERPFDESRLRALATRDVERARNIASGQNHGLLSGAEPASGQLSSLVVPTLVIHGTVDPLFALEHGVALAEEIPGARLLTLPGAGHGLYRADWDTVAPAIVEHTGIGAMQR
jgi:pimeloyl-ACP methyl ester carboxylesterase